MILLSIFGLILDFIYEYFWAFSKYLMSILSLIYDLTYDKVYNIIDLNKK